MRYTTSVQITAFHYRHIYAVKIEFMAIIDDQRHQKIKSIIMQQPDAVASVTLHLWECLSHELSSIIGEGGFQSLFARSVHLTRASFPWIDVGPSSTPIVSRFVNLKTCLEERDFGLACTASIALLNIFIDILIVLIGELVTTSILRSAWGDDAMNIAGTEPQQCTKK